MKKIVLNNCHGGYELSAEAYEFLGLPNNDFGLAFEGHRDDPRLVECVERLGEKASGDLAELIVVEYDDYNYECLIDEYDGFESLSLKPIVHIDKIKTMKLDEIIEYLLSLGIKVID